MDPREPARDLIAVGRERLSFRNRVAVEAQIPEQVRLRQVAQPLDAVGEDGNRRIADRRPFQRPTGIADHHFVQREAFFGPADEDVPPELRDLDHDAGFADQPLVGSAVVHEPGAPGHLALELESSLQQDSGVADLPIGTEVELLPAAGILLVRRIVEQDAAAHADREEGALVLVPAPPTGEPAPWLRLRRPRWCRRSPGRVVARPGHRGGLRARRRSERR